MRELIIKRMPPMPHDFRRMPPIPGAGEGVPRPYWKSGNESFQRRCDGCNEYGDSRFFRDHRA